MSAIPPYAIGSSTLPGLAKLVEEIGELQQVLGKIVAIGHAGDHWDGTNMTDKLVEEIGDVRAAVAFFQNKNLANRDDEIFGRAVVKYQKFTDWHLEAVTRGDLEPINKETL